MPWIQVEVAGVMIVLARPWQRLVGVAGARGATRGSHAHLQLGLLQSPLSHVLPGKVISERIYHQKHLSIFITVSFIIVVIQSRDKRNNTNQKEEQWKCVHFFCFETWEIDGKGYDLEKFLLGQFDIKVTVYRFLWSSIKVKLQGRPFGLLVVALVVEFETLETFA